MTAMSLPNAAEYNDAIQNPRLCFCDPELQDGVPVTNSLGLPMPWSGNFADVYQVECVAARRVFAVKCFTREVSHLELRYSEISACLERMDLPFLVDFALLEKGILVQGAWWPVIKMRWIDGIALNDWVRDSLEKPWRLETLAHAWLLLARSLRRAHVAHGDLQHGNVLLVPSQQGSRLHLKLVDYDGMFVPSLAGKKPGETGHPSYQHPQRIRDAIYSAEIDRFSHLVVLCAVRCLLAKGRKLWDDYDNGDNLLFRERDFQSPATSRLFHELWEIQDPFCRRLVGRLILASQSPLDQVPFVERVADPAQAPPLEQQEIDRVVEILASSDREPRAAPPAARTPPVEIPVASPPGVSKKPGAPAGTRRTPPRSNPLVAVAPPAIQPGSGRSFKKPLIAALAIAGAVAMVAVNVLVWMPRGAQPAAATPVVRQQRSIVSANDVADEPVVQPATNPPNVTAHPAARMPAQTQPKRKNDHKIPAHVPLHADAVTAPARGDRSPALSDEAHIAQVSRGIEKAEPTAPKRREPLLVLKNAKCRCVAYSPDNNLIATAGESAALKLWDPVKGSEIQTLSGHTDEVLGIAFSRDAQEIVSGGWDRTVKIWDPKTGSPTASLGGLGVVYSVALSPDSRWVALGSGESTLMLWNTRGKQKPRALRGHSGPVISVAFRPDGKRIASGSRDRTVKLWEFPPGRLRTTFTGHSLAVNSVAFSSDGEWLASGSDDKTVKVWNAASGQARLSTTFAEHAGPVNSVVFSPDGKWIASGSSDGTVKIWSPVDGAVLQTLVVRSGPVTGVAISPDGKRLVAVGAGDVEIWATSDHEAEPVLPSTQKINERSRTAGHGL
jgi:WD40 repeat protein